MSSRGDKQAVDDRTERTDLELDHGQGQSSGSAGRPALVAEAVNDAHYPSSAPSWTMPWAQRRAAASPSPGPCAFGGEEAVRRDPTAPRTPRPRAPPSAGHRGQAEARRLLQHRRASRGSPPPAVRAWRRSPPTVGQAAAATAARWRSERRCRCRTARWMSDRWSSSSFDRRAQGQPTPLAAGRRRALDQPLIRTIASLVAVSAAS